MVLLTETLLRMFVLLLPVFRFIFFDYVRLILVFFFFFQAEDGIRDLIVTGVQTCALPISLDRARATGPPQREPDQEVGQLRVLGQERAVKVGAEDAARPDAFGSVLPVVAEAAQDPPQRLEPRSQVSPAAVVLEADQRRGLDAQVRGVDQDVADLAPRAADGVQAEQPAPVESLSP